MHYDALSNEDFKKLLRIVEAAVAPGPVSPPPTPSYSFLTSLTASFSKASAATQATRAVESPEQKHKKAVDKLAAFFAEKMGRSLSPTEQKSIEPILEQIFEMLERCIKDTTDTYTLMLDAQFSRLLEMQIATAKEILDPSEDEALSKAGGGAGAGAGAAKASAAYSSSSDDFGKTGSADSSVAATAGSGARAGAAYPATAAASASAAASRGHTETLNGDAVTISTRFKVIRDPKKVGHFLVVPRIRIDNPEPSQTRQVSFLVDISDSMDGPGIATAQQLLSAIFANLDDRDHVNLTVFDDRVETWIPAPPPLTSTAGSAPAKAVAAAAAVSATRAGATQKASVSAEFAAKTAVLAARGGTAIGLAILSMEPSTLSVPASHTTVVLLTDGREGWHEKKPAQVLAEYNAAFTGSAPRFLPVGLGNNYDKVYLRRLGRLSNSGLLDARDLSSVLPNIGQLISRLAHGVHLSLKIGDRVLPLGVLNYNTDNELVAISVSEAELARLSYITENGETAVVCSAAEAVDEDEAALKALLEQYVEREAQRIYDDADRGFDSQIAAIRELQTLYSSYLSRELIGYLGKILDTLNDKKSGKSKAVAFAGGGTTSLTASLSAYAAPSAREAEDDSGDLAKKNTFVNLSSISSSLSTRAVSGAAGVLPAAAAAAPAAADSDPLSASLMAGGARRAATAVAAAAPVPAPGPAFSSTPSELCRAVRRGPSSAISAASATPSGLTATVAARAAGDPTLSTSLASGGRTGATLFVTASLAVVAEESEAPAPATATATTTTTAAAAASHAPAAAATTAPASDENSDGEDPGAMTRSLLSKG